MNSEQSKVPKRRDYTARRYGKLLAQRPARFGGAPTDNAVTSSNQFYSLVA